MQQACTQMTRRQASFKLTGELAASCASSALFRAQLRRNCAPSSRRLINERRATLQPRLAATSLCTRTFAALSANETCLRAGLDFALATRRIKNWGAQKSRAFALLAATRRECVARLARSALEFARVRIESKRARFALQSPPS